MIQMQKILPVFVSTLPITKDADNPMNQSELEDKYMWPPPSEGKRVALSHERFKSFF